MLKLICAIPDEIGWMILGALSILALIMFAKLIKLFIEILKEWSEEEEEEM